MALDYSAVLWNRQKRRYDVILAGLMGVYLLVFGAAQVVLFPDVTAETVLIRATSTLAFLMLHIILAIGPLCRLDRRFLPLLYNRRHLGVSMFVVAAVHGVFSLIQFHSQGNVDPLLSLFTSEREYSSFIDFPFQPLGFFALLILFVMAATSHDFWLKNLTPPVWKALHMGVYAAYVLIVFHVLLGVLQQETAPAYALLLGVGVCLLTGLHLTAAFMSQRNDLRPTNPPTDGFIAVCDVADMTDNRAKTLLIDGQNIALFRYDGKLSAVSNQCRHQNGPLGEGKIIDGCITCPWHGYQYLPENGQSPPPFTEKVATYAVRCEGTTVWVNPKPHPPGTYLPPARVDTQHVDDEPDFYIGWRPNAPAANARVVRRAMLALVLLVPLLAGLLVWQQRGFTNATFEYGQLTTFEGQLIRQPVPFLRVRVKNSPNEAPSYKRLLLIRLGKHGAEATLQQWEAKHGSLLGKSLKVRGSLIHYEGHVALELSEEAEALLSVSANKNAPPTAAPIALGVVELQGEITDPKCFLGVMKPGYGRPHRSCAVRCIAGGIPPLLYVNNGRGGRDGYILVGATGEPINNQVLAYVGKNVHLRGRVEQADNWLMLYVDSPVSVVQLLPGLGEPLAMCQ